MLFFSTNRTIWNKGFVIDVAVPEFVAEQNNLKIEYVTGVENSNFVVTFKEIVSSEEQETNEKVDTEPIEQPEAEGETTKEDSILIIV